ncbi:MAG: helix-turn-helix domain-containing protein [Kofleriaceae bacterium]
MPRSPGPPRGLLRPHAPAGRFEHARVGPTDDLAPFIAHFWWVRWDLRGHPPFVTETLPHPTVHLVFDSRCAQIRGVATGAFRKRLHATGYTFGIKFRPAAFQPWLGAPVSTITDRVLSLHALAAPLACGIPAITALTRKMGQALLQRVIGPDPFSSCPGIGQAGVPADAVVAAETFLRAYCPALSGEVAEIRDLVERMATDPAITRAEQVAELAGIELRTLQRRFIRFVGVSPKWVLQRYRLHEAAARLTAADPPTLAALSASLGYFDQAHFTRDFKAVIGASPSGYRRL